MEHNRHGRRRKSKQRSSTQIPDSYEEPSMKITSFFALSAFALLSIPAVAQQTPENPPTTTEDHIILLDDAQMEPSDADNEGMDAYRREMELARIQIDS